MFPPLPPYLSKGNILIPLWKEGQERNKQIKLINTWWSINFSKQITYDENIYRIFFGEDYIFSPQYIYIYIHIHTHIFLNYINKQIEFRKSEESDTLN